MSEHANGDSALDHQAHTRRVFVVHLRLDARPTDGHFVGRVQHVHSSDAAHFESVDELVAFIAGRLTMGAG